MTAEHRVFELRTVAWDHPDGERLRRDQQAEISARYGTDDSEPGPKPSAADITIFVPKVSCRYLAPPA